MRTKSFFYLHRQSYKPLEQQAQVFIVYSPFHCEPGLPRVSQMRVSKAWGESYVDIRRHLLDVSMFKGPQPFWIGLSPIRTSSRLPLDKLPAEKGR